MVFPDTTRSSGVVESAAARLASFEAAGRSVAVVESAVVFAASFDPDGLSLAVVESIVAAGAGPVGPGGIAMANVQPIAVVGPVGP
jgi:hypothetical protein